jgi:hypothetical protein
MGRLSRLLRKPLTPRVTSATRSHGALAVAPQTADAARDERYALAPQPPRRIRAETLAICGQLVAMTAWLA